MGGVVRAVGRAVGGVFRGAGRVIGGVVRGAGELFTGHPIKALKSVLGGVAQGAGEVIHGGLGAVKDILGDPLSAGLVGGVAGFMLGGPWGAAAGAMLGPMIGQAGAGVVGALDNGVVSLFGLGGDQMAGAHNGAAFGPGNGGVAMGPGGTYSPWGNPGMWNGPWQGPPRTGCCCPCSTQFA